MSLKNEGVFFVFLNVVEFGEENLVEVKWFVDIASWWYYLIAVSTDSVLNIFNSIQYYVS